MSKISRKKQRRNLKLFTNVFESIISFVICTLFKLGFIIIESIFVKSFMIDFNSQAKVTSKIEVKIKERKGERYLKIDCLKFYFFIQVGQPTASIVIHNVLRLNWQPVVWFYGTRYWNPHIVYCGINNNNNTSILVQRIEVKDGLVNRNNDIPLLYICLLFHCGNHTLAHVHKRVDGIPYFNHITLTHVFLAMKKVITEPTISFM